jgi:hypothetical protein
VIGALQARDMEDRYTGHFFFDDCVDRQGCHDLIEDIEFFFPIMCSVIVMLGCFAFLKK